MGNPDGREASQSETAYAVKLLNSYLAVMRRCDDQVSLLDTRAGDETEGLSTERGPERS